MDAERTLVSASVGSSWDISVANNMAEFRDIEDLSAQYG
jgi:hypothetical protein